MQSGDRNVGRPPTLTVEKVIEAAMGLADEAGLDGLSMPKLAARLDVGTMTLYGYVDSKEDLLDRVAARIFDGLVLPAAGPWHERLVEYFRRFREAALAHASLTFLLASGRIRIPAVFDTLEEVLRSGSEAGVDTEQSIRAFYAGLSYTLGFVVWEATRTGLQDEAAYHAEWEALLDGLDPQQHPLLTGPARSVVSTVASDNQFEWGLVRVLRREDSAGMSPTEA